MEHQKKFGVWSESEEGNSAAKLQKTKSLEGHNHKPITSCTETAQDRERNIADLDARIARLKAQLLEFETAQAYAQGPVSASQELEGGFEQVVDQGIEEEVAGVETDLNISCTSQLNRPCATGLELDGTGSPTNSAEDAAATYEVNGESSLPKSRKQDLLNHDVHRSVSPFEQQDPTNQENTWKDSTSQTSQARADNKVDSMAAVSQRPKQSLDEQLADCWNCLSWLDERETSKQQTHDNSYPASVEEPTLTAVSASPESVEDPQSDRLLDPYRDLDVYFGKKEALTKSLHDSTTGTGLEATAVQNTGTDDTTALTVFETGDKSSSNRPPILALPLFFSRDKPPYRPVIQLPSLTLEQRNYLKIHGLLADQPQIKMEDAQDPDPAGSSSYPCWAPPRKAIAPTLTALEARAAGDAQFLPPDTSQNPRWPNPRQPFHAELLTGAAYFTRWQRWADHIHEEMRFAT
ncbi:MAG: hypothetical protein Q9165_006141 [Trypethelium subeluteriae]